jgi:hypothetical protein
VERLKDLQAIKGEDLVRINIHASLRGSALDWYTVELTDFERRSLRQLPLVDGRIDVPASQVDEDIVAENEANGVTQSLSLKMTVI